MLKRIFNYRSDIIEYSIEYKENVKNITIKILPTAEVRVVAPKSESLKKIDDFVLLKKSWIDKQIKKILEKLNSKIERTYQEGDIFYYLGKKYFLSLKYDDGSGERVILDNENNSLNVYIEKKENKDKIKELLEKWFEKKSQIQLKAYVEEAYEKYKENIPDIKHIEIKVKSLKSAWGKCYINTYEIHINSKLIHAPRRIIDYVILHELCHFVYPNHSVEYKIYLSKFIPNWKELKEELKYESKNYFV